MNVPALITYPARPIQGGRLELAPTKRVWYAKPKLNGWRTIKPMLYPPSQLLGCAAAMHPKPRHCLSTGRFQRR